MTMSRTTKSVAAVGVGVLLLTAAGGTFARWSVSEPVDGGTITAGHLKMEVSEGTWHDMKTDTLIADPAAFRIVPGDVLQYRATITPELVGNNLEAELESDITTALGTMVPYILPPVATLDGAPSQTLTPAGNGDSYAAVVSIEMPYGEGTATYPDGGEDTTLDLSTLEISLIQTPNP